MVSFLSQSPAKTKRLATKILALAAKKKLRPVVMALSGELGSGKTTFIQGLTQALGIRQKVQSPSFVLMKVYKIGQGPKVKGQMFYHFIHIDAYRIERAFEARHLGLKEIFKDRDAVVVVEWAERIKKSLPPGTIWINFQHGSRQNERLIKFKI